MQQVDIPPIDLSLRRNRHYINNTQAEWCKKGGYGRCRGRGERERKRDGGHYLSSLFSVYSTVSHMKHAPVNIKQQLDLKLHSNFLFLFTS